MIHQSVLPKETLQYLAPKPGQVIVDATLGAGGHTAAILKALGSDTAGGSVVALDRDASAIEAAAKRFTKEIAAGRLSLAHARFSQLAGVLQELAMPAVDAVLIDAGVSSDQLLSESRGFSFASNAPLDMRMDQRDDLTAAKIIAEWPEEKLRDQLYLVGERSARKIAQAIVAARKEQPIERTDQLVELLQRTIPASSRGRALNPATKTFLALRMAVNRELEELKAGLDAALKVLKPGGRLVVISFQSLEDGLVKKTFKEWTRGCICPPELPICTCGHSPLVTSLTKKPITPSPQENATNPRARSAKLRACQKL